MSTKNKLEEVFGKIEPSQWIEAAQQQKQNRAWLRYSQEIALALLELMDQRNMTQKSLAEQMNVSPQLINKWVKGKENFTLETVSKLEAVFGVKLLKIESKSNRISIPVELTKVYKVEYVWPVTNTGSGRQLTTKVINFPQRDFAKAN